MINNKIIKLGLTGYIWLLGCIAHAEMPDMQGVQAETNQEFVVGRIADHFAAITKNKNEPIKIAFLESGNCQLELKIVEKLIDKGCKFSQLIFADTHYAKNCEATNHLGNIRKEVQKLFDNSGNTDINFVDENCKDIFNAKSVHIDRLNGVIQLAYIDAELITDKWNLLYSKVKRAVKYDNVTRVCSLRGGAIEIVGVTVNMSSQHAILNIPIRPKLCLMYGGPQEGYWIEKVKQFKDSGLLKEDAQVEELARALSLLPEFCKCISSDNRQIAIQKIVKNFLDTNPNKTEPLSIAFFGSGGCQTEVELLNELIKEGYKFSNLYFYDITYQTLQNYKYPQTAGPISGCCDDPDLLRLITEKWFGSQKAPMPSITFSSGDDMSQFNKFPFPPLDGLISFDVPGCVYKSSGCYKILTMFVKKDAYREYRKLHEDNTPNVHVFKMMEYVAVL